MTMMVMDVMMAADNDDDHGGNHERQLYRFWRERGTVRGEGGESALAGRPGERGARLKIAG